MDQSTTDQSATVWQDRIDGWLASGISIAKWCKEHQVAYHQFIYQKNKLSGRKHKRGKAATPKGQFVELTDAASKDPGVAIEYGGVRICLMPDFDEATLLRCVQIVRRAV